MLNGHPFQHIPSIPSFMYRTKSVTLEGGCGLGCRIYWYFCKSSILLAMELVQALVLRIRDICKISIHEHYYFRD
jgi:hypothetical protein